MNFLTLVIFTENYNLKLNSNQKSILKGFSHVFAWEDLPDHVLTRVIDMNGYETIHHDINRFLGDQFIVERLHDLKRKGA